VLIRGKRCKPLRRLYRGDVVALERPAPRPVSAPSVQAPTWKVLYAGEHALAIDKPAGWTVDATLTASLAAQQPGWDVGGQAEPGVVHRLDKDTSGCLVFARTDAGLAALHAAFEADQVEKTYLAVVRGTPPPEGRIDTAYGRDPKDPRRYTTREGLSLVEVTLETGRTHQIRVQLAEAGWPVLADAFYGTRESRTHPLAPPRQALHAWRLSFPEPLTGKRIALESPIPADLAAIAKRLRATGT
jgi:23S rRNA pseudouridine1911/1915/1917 synthase